MSLVARFLCRLGRRGILDCFWALFCFAFTMMSGSVLLSREWVSRARETDGKVVNAKM